MKSREFLRRRSIVALSLVGCAMTIEPAAAQTIEQFYRGRTINFAVASAPGGINDLLARLIARHLGKHIPGNPSLVVQNQQGASGLSLANRIYFAAEKDGTAIAILERGTP